MRRRVRNFWDLIIVAANEFGEDHAAKLSASLAYYTLFSIGPLLLVIITVLGFIYEKATITAGVFEQVSAIIGPSATADLQTVLNNMSKQTNTTLFGIIGGLVFIFGATGIFSEIQTSINYIWSIRAKPKRGWLKYILDRLVSLLLVFGMGIILLVTIFANFVIDMVADKLPRFLGDVNIVLIQSANIAVLFLIVTTVFTIIFKVLPDARIHLRDAVVGALFTGVLFLIGKMLISYYLSMAKNINAYGAATSFILLLTWVYYCAMILYFGAEFTEAYARKWGRGIKVGKNAVHIIKNETQDIA
ncbi:MAG: ribonuclease [Flavipsychrobacter sp.]|jgi:membrane protein|nr:ribonuclease [Flavipsychrobacter sp.]